VVVWSVLFSLWSVWEWWAAPVGIAAALAAHRLMLNSAATYGGLFAFSYDVHRRLLDESVTRSLPQSSA
jgi:hypothetical protein